MAALRVLIADADPPRDRLEDLAEQVARHFFDARWAPVDLMAVFEENRAQHIARICGGFPLGHRDATRVWKRATRLLAAMRREAGL